MVKLGRVNGGVRVGDHEPLDARFRKFVNHVGLKEVSKMFSTSVDLDATRKDFEKMVNDFNGKPLKVNMGEEHQDQDLKDEDEEEHQDQDLEDEDEDKHVDESEGEEDDAKGKLFGDTKRSSLVKRLHAPIGDELEPKKPRIAESSCVPGDKTGVAEMKNSTLQGLMTG